MWMQLQLFTIVHLWQILLTKRDCYSYVYSELYCMLITVTYTLTELHALQVSCATFQTTGLQTTSSSSESWQRSYMCTNPLMLVLTELHCQVICWHAPGLKVPSCTPLGPLKNKPISITKAILRGPTHVHPCNQGMKGQLLTGVAYQLWYGLPRDERKALQHEKALLDCSQIWFRTSLKACNTLWQLVIQSVHKHRT